MYLKRLLLLNSGPIERCALEFPFEEGRPKPMLLVGTNGAGKTNTLSVIADALMELAATHYQDVLPSIGLGHQFYRVSGGRTRRAGARWDVSALHFIHDGQDIYFRNAAGEVPYDQLTTELEPFGPVGAGNRDKQEKITHLPTDLASKVFLSGVYSYFPSSRHEIPHWLNDKSLERDPPLPFGPRFATVLNKPMVVAQGLQELKPWIVDVILDQAVDAATALAVLKDPAKNLPIIEAALTRRSTLIALNDIVRAILRRGDARLVRAIGQRGDNRIQVLFADNNRLPTLDALSAGQSTLLSIFASVFRLGTTLSNPATPASATGIVLVDEIDAHLHADLQYEALPNLIAQFPNVQFILTCHSPLVPLGMEKKLGNSGFVLLEMPKSEPISCERYSEFLRSFEMYRDTKAFEESLKRLGVAGKPIVIGEGETDPLYIVTAAELLGYADLVENVEFRFVGDLDATPKKSSGQGQLKKAVEIYRASLPLLGRRVCCLFDQKSTEQVKVRPFSDGPLSVCVLPLISDHPFANDGPENLLPNDVFEDRFFANEVPRLQGEVCP